jgi:hypothetical protein
MVEAYQLIDVALSGDKILDLAPPVKGFVVTYPDKHLDAEYVEEDCDIDALKAKSKWPESVFVRPCWIHSEPVVFGQIQKRKFWTPR